MIKKTVILLALSAICISCNYKKETSVALSDNNRLFLAVGAYSDGTTPGISLYDFNSQSGDFEFLSEIHGVANPSYLVVSPDENFLYSVNETLEGAVSSFALDRSSATLSHLNSQATMGSNPCFINIDSKQTTLITANYSGGNISVFPLNKQGDIGTLSQTISFTPQSHLHTVVFSPDENYLLATDLGKDKIYVLSMTYSGNGIYLTLEQDKTATLEAGSGPRHLTFHPNKDVVYCINELSGRVTVFDFEDGVLSPLQYIAADTTGGSRGKGSADIHLTPDGKFLYASNRLQADGIAIFSVHPETGTLQRIGYQETGIHPRNFILSPNGKFLLCANRDSHTIQIFEINPRTGLLRNTGKEISVRQPVCLKWIKR